MLGLIPLHWLFQKPILINVSVGPTSQVFTTAMLNTLTKGCEKCQDEVTANKVMIIPSFKKIGQLVPMLMMQLINDTSKNNSVYNQYNTI
jgi:hypothetical protein